MADQKQMGKELVKSFVMPKDVLQSIFEAQEKFGSKFCNFRMYANGDPHFFGREKKEWKDTFLDCIFDEISEVLNWLPWKHWKNYNGFEINVTELRFELIDILHFIVSEFLLYGISAEKVYDSIIEDKRPALDKVTDMEELIAYCQGGLYVETRVDLTPVEAKIKVTRGLLRNMINKIGKAYVDNNLNLVEDFYAIFFTLLQLFGLWDMKAQDVYDYYMSKNQENFNRQERGY
jgi:hypothetical protein